MSHVQLSAWMSIMKKSTVGALIYTNDMLNVHKINAGLLSSLFHGRLTLIHQKTAASHFYAAHHLLMGLKHAGHPPQMR